MMKKGTRKCMKCGVYSTNTYGANYSVKYEKMLLKDWVEMCKECTDEVFGELEQ